MTGSAPSPAAVTFGISDPYAHLSPEQRAALEDELKQAEINYGEKMRQAEGIADEAERRPRLEGLRNSFGTKQSMIRKRYGVRLRERRTKAEIDAERARMGMKSRSNHGTGEKRRRSVRSPSLTTQAAPGSETWPSSTQASTQKRSSAWKAANIPTDELDHEAKRRRLEGASAESMYILSSSPAKSEDSPEQKPANGTHMLTPPPSTQAPDGSSKPVQIYKQVGVRVGVRKPEGPARQPATVSNAGSPVTVASPGTNREKPVNIDDSSSSDDGDIPATLPSATANGLALEEED